MITNKIFILGKHTSDGGIIWYPTQKKKKIGK